jgi:hypothetical protein
VSLDDRLVEIEAQSAAIQAELARDRRRIPTPPH